MKYVLEVEPANGKRATGYVDNLDCTPVLVLEVGLKRRRIDCRIHEDNFQRLIPGAPIIEESLDDCEREISIDVAFMDLIDNNVGNIVQTAVVMHLALTKQLQCTLHALQENTRSAESDRTMHSGEFGIKSDLVPDL